MKKLPTSRDIISRFIYTNGQFWARLLSTEIMTTFTIPQFNYWLRHELKFPLYLVDQITQEVRSKHVRLPVYIRARIQPIPHDAHSTSAPIKTTNKRGKHARRSTTKPRGPAVA